MTSIKRKAGSIKRKAGSWIGHTPLTIFLLLALAACGSTNAAPEAGATQGVPAKQELPADDLAPTGFPNIEIKDPAPRKLASGSTLSLIGLSLERAFDCALDGIMYAGATQPVSESEFAHWLFSWPANLDAPQPLPRVPVTSLGPVGTPVDWPCGIAVDFELVNGNLQASATLPSISDEADRQPVWASPAIQALTSDFPVDYEAQPVSLPPASEIDSNPQHYQALALQYRDGALSADEARIATCQRTIIRLLKSAVSFSSRIPTDWNQVVEGTGTVLINVSEAATPEAADVAVWADGQQAFRFVVRYPSGVVQDSTLDFWKIEGRRAHFREVATAAWEQGTGRSAEHLLLAVTLVPREQAALPNGSCN